MKHAWFAIAAVVLGGCVATVDGASPTAVQAGSPSAAIVAEAAPDESAATESTLLSPPAEKGDASTGRPSKPAPAPDAGPPPPSPDAAPVVVADAAPAQVDSAPPADACPGYTRVHVGDDVCVQVRGCEGYILVGSDVLGGAMFSPGAPMPAACVSGDQDSCVLYGHASHPATSYDVFIKPSKPASCVIRTEKLSSGVCPFNYC